MRKVPWLLVLALVGSSAHAGMDYLAPEGGWTYVYTGDAAAAGATGSFDALDGVWDHDNGSDAWDGTAIGEGKPGGVASIDGFLRLQDPGDPRDYGFSPDPTNRKIMFGYSITSELGEAADAILDNGVTMSFRARVATGAPLDDVHPDGGAGTAPWPEAGNGYVIHDGGKGNFSIRQLMDDKIVSFALALPTDDDELEGRQGLVMNKLNGAAPTGDVDLQGDEPGTLNILELDPADWHEYWITIQADDTGVGTHLVRVYVDGALEASEFIVTAGNGDDYGDSYLAMGVGATPQDGAVDVDFLAYTSGAIAPVPEPATIALLGLGVCALLRRRR